MKATFINLVSFLEASKSHEIFESFKKINCLTDVRDTEFDCIKEISKAFLSVQTAESSKFSGYIIGACYKGVVSEEFDILRFSKGTIINIELKSKKVDEDKIKKQLKRHRFFLQSIDVNRDVRLFTYEAETKRIFELIDDELKPQNFSDILKRIPEDYLETNLLSVLDYNSFIISPYSEPERFFKSQYFLNIEQESARNSLLKSTANFIVLKGSPGTGKSLILFDTAKKMSQAGKSILYVFCSRLEQNELRIIEENVEFKFIDIRAANELTDEQFLQYDVLIIDESQRLKEHQLKKFIKLFKGKKLILSVDRKQTLRPEEKELDVQGIFEKNSKKETIDVVDTLTKKVRTDVELSTFIKKFFNKKARDLTVMEFPKVNMVYFDSIDSATPFFKHCVENEKFTPIELPEYKYSGELSKVFGESLDSFKVIGREYDKVLLTLNDRVKYNQDKQLCVPIQKKYPYLAENSLFQAITRTRKELLLLIIGNKELFLEIEKILTWKKFKDNSNISKRLKSLREVNNKTIEELTDIVNDYFDIENTGIIPNRKISKALAKFYNVSWQFIEGEVSDLRYSDFEIAYRNKTKNYNREQKKKLQESLLDFLEKYDN